MEVSDAIYMKMIEDLEDYAILLIDPVGTIQSWNKGAEKIIGYSREEIIGSNFRMFYTADDQNNELPENLLKEATDKQSAKYEGWRIRKDGSQFWGDIVITSLRDDAGGLIGFTKMTRDLTQKKEAQDKLLEFNENLEQKIQEAAAELYTHENKFRALIENSSDAIILQDANGKITFVSKSFERVLGYSLEDLRDDKDYQFLHPEDKLIAKARATEAELNPGVPVYGMNRVRHKNGHFIWTEGTTTNLLNDPNVQALVSNFSDVTRRREAEIQLQTSYREIENLLNNTEEIFLTLDVDFNIVTFNKTAWDVSLKFIGRGFEKGLSLLEYTPPDNAETLREILKSVLGGTISEKDAQYAFDDGEVAYFHTVMKPLYNATGEIGGIFVIDRIVTEEVIRQRQIDFDKNNLDALLNSTRDMMWSIDTEFRLIASNKVFIDYMATEFGYILATGSSVFSSEFSHGQREQWHTWYERAFTGDIFTVVTHADNEEDAWFEISFYPIRQVGKVIGTACYSRDISQRKADEKKLINANRIYSFISHINQTIVHAKNEQEVFDRACEIAVEHGKFQASWISLLNDAQKKLNIVSHAGFTEDDLERLRGLTYAEHGMAARVRATGQYVAVNFIVEDKSKTDIKKFSLKKGYKSCIVLPIKKSGVTIGLYTLFADRYNMFVEDEIRLLEEAVGDISFACDVFEKDAQRQQAEERLKHSELNLKQAQAIAHFGSVVLSLSTGETEWSDEARRIYGILPGVNISLEEWVGYVHPDDMDYVLPVINQYQRDLKSIAIHHRIIAGDGRVRYLHSQSHVEFDLEGIPVRIYGVAHDLTDVREAEFELAQSEANLRLILDMIPQSIYAKDIHGRFSFANKNFAALYDLLPEQMIDKTATEVIPDFMFGEELLKSDEHVIQSGQTETIPLVEFRGKSGARLLLQTTKVPFRVPRRKEQAILGIVDDITVQTLAEAERTKMIDDIVQRNKDLEQFSFIVSHNLRAPVANIIGIANLLNYPGLSTEDQATLANDLSTSVNRLDDVIRDLNFILQVRHVENSKKEPVFLQELVDNIVQSMTSAVVGENAKIAINISLTEPMYTNKAYLYSIFYNLLSNSIKYRQATVNPEIEISGFAEHGKIVFVFKDNGLGIDLMKKGGQVFGLYRRFHNHVEGKGVGLFMVKTQVESLGGTISVHSEVNKGTEFRIEFNNE